MIYIPFVCLGVVCLAMGALYTLFKDKEGWQGLLSRGLTFICLVVFASVCANLLSLINAITIFIPLGLTFLMLGEVSELVSLDKNAKTLIVGIVNIVGFLLLSLCAVSLSAFNVLALVGGLLLGGGVGLLVWSLKKYKNVTVILLEIFTYIAIGLIISFAILGLAKSAHLISAIFALVGGLLILAQKLMKTFAGQNALVVKISNALYILGLLFISAVVFFF